MIRFLSCAIPLPKYDRLETRLIFYSFPGKMSFPLYSFIKMVNVLSCYQSFFLNVTQMWIRQLAELHPQILDPPEAKTNLVHAREDGPNLLNTDRSSSCRRQPINKPICFPGAYLSIIIVLKLIARKEEYFQFRSESNI